MKAKGSLAPSRPVIETAARLAIEAETPGDNRTMFRVSIAQKVVATGRTAASAHWLVGLALERITHPQLADAGEELRARRRRRMRLREVLGRRP